MECYGECWGKTITHEEVSEYFSCERLRVKKFREDAEKEKQEGIQRPMATRIACHLEQVKCCEDTPHSQDGETGLLCVERRRLGRI